MKRESNGKVTDKLSRMLSLDPRNISFYLKFQGKLFFSRESFSFS